MDNLERLHLVSIGGRHYRCTDCGRTVSAECSCCEPPRCGCWQPIPSQSRRTAPGVGESNGGTPREKAPGEGRPPQGRRPVPVASFWRRLFKPTPITIHVREPDTTRVQLALLRGGRP
jgi:hypothetical protein